MTLDELRLTERTLTAAFDLIKSESDWIKNKWYTVHHAVKVLGVTITEAHTLRCAYQAVKDATSNDALLIVHAIAALEAELPESWRWASPPGVALLDFNDHDSTKHRDIVELYEKAIATTRRKIATEKERLRVQKIKEDALAHGKTKEGLEFHWASRCE